MTQEVGINKVSYQKAIFHCLRYPSQNVIGLLTGTHENIKNAYPLFHTPVVSPSLEIAFDLVESQLGPGESIVGVYSSAITCQVPVGELSSRLAESIEKSIGKEAIIMNIYVDEKDHQAILTYKLIAGTSKRTMASKQHQIQSLQKDIGEGLHRQIVDMDAHFENIELDFTNSYIQ